MSGLSAVRSGLGLGLALVLGLGLASATYVYQSPDSDLTYDVKNCEIFNGELQGTPKQIECQKNEGILETWPDYSTIISENQDRTDEILCRGQRGVCKSKYEYMTDLEGGCREMVDGCRSALRHIQEMMIKIDPNQQVCNNFALKSVRGFFHDYMTSDIEGSVLSENHLEMNVGLCRWTQYVNVLSDHTGCDAGSIVQMGGFLGFEACGMPLFTMDIHIKPYVFLNGGMSCAARSTGDDATPKKTSHPLFDATTGQRLMEFEDVTISADSAMQEKFWCSVNPHSCATGENASTEGNLGLSDGEIEYSGDATAAAHVIGRVTCPVSGHARDGSSPDIKTGFFHLPRTPETAAIGVDALRARVDEGYTHLAATQCGETADYPGVPSSDGYVPTGGVRVETDEWPRLEGETNLNTGGGLCGMPTMFQKSIHVGSRFRVPRFMNIAALSRFGEQTEFQQQQCTDNTRTLYIPLELLTLRTAVQLPTSPALDRFLAIAWDGVGTIDSAWDTCVVGCDIDVSKNRMCGGEGLQNFEWAGPCFGLDCGSNGNCDADRGTCKCLNEYKGELCQLAPENCLDGVKNGEEDEVDCGGPDCPYCTDYRFFAGEWGECPVSCGGGFMEREVWCEEAHAPGVAVSDDLCLDLDLHPPKYEEACGNSECASYQWEYADWTDCTTVCGGGTMTRSAACFSSLATAPVPDSFCDVGEKEDTSQDCNPEACVKNHWVTDWGECDLPCGGGQQSATLACMTVDDEVTDSSLCDEDETPLITRACHEAACPVATGEWAVCAWDACTTACGGSSSTMAGAQFRIVLCRDAITSVVTDPALCPEVDRPMEIVTGCNPIRCTAPYWMTTAWTGCVDAKRARTYHCHDENGENALNDMCEDTGVPLPVVEEACVVNACPITSTRYLDPAIEDSSLVSLATTTTAWPAAIIVLAATLRVFLELV